MPKLTKEQKEYAEKHPKMSDTEIMEKCKAMQIVVEKKEWNAEKDQACAQLFSSSHFKTLEAVVGKFKSSAMDAISELQPADNSLDVRINLAENLASIRMLEALLLFIKNAANKPK